MRREKRTAIGAAVLIVLMLAGVGLFSFRTGYRMGSDLAQHEARN